MIRARLATVASWLGAQGVALDTELRGVTTDSRVAAPGQLFIPLVGERFDGHQFVRSAMAQGAAGFLWERERPLPEDLAALPHLLVMDTQTALQDLARAYRRTLDVRVIGVTGSNGKTSTKDLIAQALGTALRTHKTAGSMNNEIGLPLTLLTLPEDTEIVVLEMGMRGPGEIAALADIARVDIGVITLIGDAHIGRLGSRAAIAKAKWELVEALGSGGVAVIPADEPLLDALAAPAGGTVGRFGAGPPPDWRLQDYQAVAGGGEFRVLPPDVSVSLPIAGRHQAGNALCAMAVAGIVGVDMRRAAHALASASLSRMRMEMRRPHPLLTVVNDAYNASPSSVYAALEVLRDMQVDCRIAVLGDMLELGQESERLHRDVGRSLRKFAIDALLGVGEQARFYLEGADGLVRAALAPSAAAGADALHAWIAGELALGRRTAVLLKGSRKMGLETLLPGLERWG
ncbi:MAG: UDP-N-acetylmuramoyl-tripeptide--D-alanyl-D-alanine ligase [Bacilli bacterium]